MAQGRSSGQGGERGCPHAASGSPSGGVLVAIGALPQGAREPGKMGAASGAVSSIAAAPGGTPQDGILGAHRSMAARTSSEVGRGPAIVRRAWSERMAGPRAHRRRVERAVGRSTAGRPGHVGCHHVPGLEGAVGDMNLLFLSQTLPSPPDGGVWIRTYHVLRLLARAFDIAALCFERSATSGKGAAWHSAASRDALDRFAAVEVFPIPQRHSRLRYAWDHLRSVALRRVYTAYRYDSRAYHTRLTDLLSSEAFDLVHVDSLGDLAGSLPACRGIPVVCVHHDVESALLQRRAAIERSEWRGADLRYQARPPEEEERHRVGRVALNFRASQHDPPLLKRMAPAARIAIVPNGVDIEEVQAHCTPGTRVAFLGGASPFPN